MGDGCRRVEGRTAGLAKGSWRCRKCSAVRLRPKRAAKRVSAPEKPPLRLIDNAIRTDYKVDASRCYIQGITRISTAPWTMASSSRPDNPLHLRKISSQRLPPPYLFQGPPSHNASNLSLPQPVSTVTSRGGSQPPPSQRNRPSRAPESFDTQSSLSPFRSRAQPKGEVDSSDAIWQEMQSALSEVELSAMTSEHVFGEKHSDALEDLRRKQLKLAQAWARSEADEVVDPKATEERRHRCKGGIPRVVRLLNGRLRRISTIGIWTRKPNEISFLRGNGARQMTDISIE